MTDLLKLTRIGFDSLENRDPEFIAEEILFIGEEKINAYSKCGQYLSTLVITPYIGYNDEIYPKFIVKKVYAR